jgi:hypothetical protein
MALSTALLSGIRDHNPLCIRQNLDHSAANITFLFDTSDRTIAVITGGQTPLPRSLIWSLRDPTDRR